MTTQQCTTELRAIKSHVYGSVLMFVCVCVCVCVGVGVGVWVEGGGDGDDVCV